jgi:hypothetical protein
VNGRSILRPVFLVSLMVFAVVAIGCGKKQSVGSEKLTQFKEQEASKCRLGQACPTPSPSQVEQGQGSLALGKSPTPAASVQAQPQPQEQTYTITLVTDSPWFHDNNNQPATSFQISAGTTLRVINKDTSEERPTRSFTTADFDSGDMGRGATWTYKLAQSGRWEVHDNKSPFILATLEVY